MKAEQIQEERRAAQSTHLPTIHSTVDIHVWIHTNIYEEYEMSGFLCHSYSSDSH